MSYFVFILLLRLIGLDMICAALGYGKRVLTKIIPSLLLVSLQHIVQLALLYLVMARM